MCCPLTRLLNLKRHREMDWLWVVFTLSLNFQLTYGSTSSYGLFQGSAHTGAVHRHRNRWGVLFCFPFLFICLLFYLAFWDFNHALLSRLFFYDHFNCAGGKKKKKRLRALVAQLPIKTRPGPNFSLAGKSRSSVKILASYGQNGGR